MAFGQTILYPANATGIKHTTIKKNGQTIGHSTEYLVGPEPSPLSKMQIEHYQRQLRLEAHKKNWEELIRDIKEDDLINQRLAQQAKSKKETGWQKPCSPWINIWKKDAELRWLFNNNYLHMRRTATKKNYTTEWIFQLKQEQKKA